MQSLQLDIFVPVLVDQRHGMGLEMFTIMVFAAEEIGCDGMVDIQFLAVTMLTVCVHPSPSVQRVSVLLRADMPMRVRAREPCSQQSYTDQQGDNRGCLAQTVQHSEQCSGCNRHRH